MMVSVLIIDDNPEIVYSVSKGLEVLGYEVVGAGGGTEAIEKIQEHLPDIIICDIMMPDMNGWDVVAKIRENNAWKDTPILFLTAKDDAISKSMAKHGVNDYVVKPVEIHVLDARIKKLIQ